MNESISSEVRSSHPPAARVTVLTRIIAVFEVVGGVLGLVMSLVLTMSARLDSTSAAVFIAPNCLAVYGGILLWRGAGRGYVISSALQLAQLIRFSSSFLFYEFVLGFAFTVGAGVRSFFFYPKIGSTGLIALAHTGAPFRIGINVVAVAALIYLLRRWKLTRDLSHITYPQTTGGSP